MLMLVVTIIIAAVVATFASGLVTEQVKAPTIVVNTQILSEETDQLCILHLEERFENECFQ